MNRLEAADQLEDMLKQPPHRGIFEGGFSRQAHEALEFAIASLRGDHAQMESQRSPQ